MSIKLSIKDLKELLKIQNKQIRKRRRKHKKLIKNTNDNYNKSSSDHMKSIGFTNTTNEATELIRLQRQALEEKLKDDKEKKFKYDEYIHQAPKYPLLNNGGSNNLRDIYNDYVKSFRTTPARDIEEIDEEIKPTILPTGYESEEVVMPSHEVKENTFKNVLFKHGITPTSDTDVDEMANQGAFSSWDIPADSVFTTATPMKNKPELKASTPLKIEEKAEEKADEKAEESKPKKSATTFMKLREKPPKIDNVRMTATMIVKEFKKYPEILKKLKSDKITGWATMDKASLESLFHTYFNVDPQWYFNSGKQEIERDGLKNI